MKAPALKLRTGDTVMVIAGNDKGRTGVVREVRREAQRVVVEGVNLRWKHRKPTQKNPKGERVQIEIAIHASNVMHVDPESGKPTRRAPARAEKRGAQKGAAEPAATSKKTSKKKAR